MTISKIESDLFSKLALHNAIAYAVLGFAGGALIPALDQRMLLLFGNPV